MKPSRKGSRSARTAAGADERPPRIKGWRLWVFRAALIFIAPLLFLSVLETALRVAGYGYPASFFVPSKVNGKPVLIENERFGWRFFPPRAARAPRPMVVPALKSEGTCRVFVFGESAAYGDPKPDFGFPRMIEVLLKERFPGRSIEVINVAMTAINSHVILPIARECAGKSGDVWVIYMGNNEVVGPYGGGTVFGPQAPPLFLARSSIALRSTRTGQLIDAAAQRLKSRKLEQSDWGGMEMFVDNRVSANDPRMERIYSHFQSNLRDIIDAGRRAGVEVILCTVGSNLQHCPPFGSEKRVLPDGDDKWRRAYEAGVKAQESGNHPGAVVEFSAAAKLDDTHAELFFRLGRSQLLSGRTNEARVAFAKARDEDTLRFRADTRLNQIVRETAAASKAFGVRLVDVDELLARASTSGIPGSDHFYEHVHFNFAGNFLVARAIAGQIVDAVPQLSGTATGQGWINEKECARRLAFTDFDRLGIAELLQQRMRRPPFTFQYDHAERDARLAAEIARWRGALSGDAFSLAVTICREALAQRPEDWVLHENMAELLHEFGDVAGAAAACKRVTELLPHHPEAWCQLGLFQEQLGRLEDARSALAEALRQRRGFPRALYGMGLLQLRDQRFADAAEFFRQALQRDAKLDEAQLGLADAYAGLGRTNDAVALCRKILETRPDHAAARSKLASLMEGGQYGDRLAFLAESVRRNPNDAAAHLQLGKALTAVGRWDDAGTNFAEALRLAPGNAEAHYFRGLQFARQEKTSEALAAFAESVRLDPADKDARLNYGVSLARMGRLAEAAAQFEAVLKLDPQNGPAKQYLQTARSRLNERR